jgi:hypothetical protein
MKMTRYKNVNAVVEKGMKVLYRALGPIDTRRFFEAKRPPREDSVAAHRRWQKSLDKEAFFKAVFGGK